jgi:hypothetical protein
MTLPPDLTDLRAYVSAILAAKGALENRDDLEPIVTGSARLSPTGRVIITVEATISNPTKTGHTTRGFTFALRPEEAAANAGFNRSARLVRDWLIPTLKGI